jgi:competence protein ComEC
MLGAYLVLFGLFWRRRLQDWAMGLTGWARLDLAARIVGPALLIGLTVGSVLLWSAVAALPDGRLHVWFLDIGQGDGILIQTPSGRRVLIDGGASPQQLFSELGAAMPFWERSLDLAVLTHPDGDHMIAQADAPLRFQIAAAWDTATGQANPDGNLWRERMAANGAAVQLQHAGGWADLGDGVALWVLWPPPEPFPAESEDNENSLVLKLVYRDFSVLLTGDAGVESEAVWLRTGAPLAATVLKVGHHGSSHSTGADLVAAVDPQVAVVQVGAENDYGHPTAEVLENLAGRWVLRNDLDGRVHMMSDGRQMWVTQETGSQQLE